MLPPACVHAAEEAIPIPARSGDGAGHRRERFELAALPVETVFQHCDRMLDAVPFPHEFGSGYRIAGIGDLMFAAGIAFDLIGQQVQHAAGFPVGPP